MPASVGAIRFGQLIDQTFYVKSRKNQKQIYTWQTPEQHGASVMGQLRRDNDNIFVVNFYGSNGKGLFLTRIRLERDPKHPGQTAIVLSMPDISLSSKRYVIQDDGRVTPKLSIETDGQKIVMIRDALTLWERFKNATQNEGADTFQKNSDSFPLVIQQDGKRKTFVTLGQPMFPNQDNLLIQGKLEPDAYAVPDAEFRVEFHGMVADYPELTVVRLTKNQQDPKTLDVALSVPGEAPYGCKLEQGLLDSMPLTEIRRQFILVAEALRERVLKASQGRSTAN